jgi:hypothetical protein
MRARWKTRRPHHRLSVNCREKLLGLAALASVMGLAGCVPSPIPRDPAYPAAFSTCKTRAISAVGDEPATAIARYDELGRCLQKAGFFPLPVETPGGAGGVR